MTHSNLITVFNGNIQHQSIQLCNARDLHQFLESEQQFANWISNRISEYGFIENEDYVTSQIKTGGRGRAKTEYHITLDMGKELAMVERNDKGRQIRKYFIECEKQARLQNPQQNLPLASPEADEEALEVITRLYHALVGGYELSQQLHKPDHRYLRTQIDTELGGHYIHNLYHPTRNALEQAKKYIHAKSERIMYIKGMLSLLNEPLALR